MTMDNNKPTNAMAKNEDHSAKPVSRRRLLGWTAGGSIALAGAIVGQGLRPEIAQAHGLFRVEVAPVLDSFDAVREPETEGGNPSGPFYIEGPIYEAGTLDEEGVAPEDAEAIGLFRCWGWLFDTETGDGAVCQSFEFDDLGEIQVQGRDLGDKAITGGIGAFNGVSGHMIRQDINPENFSFLATFGFQ